MERLTAALSDRYTVERELGSGGMATVYLAHDLKHERNVALKVLRPDVASEIGADRFLREIKLAARLTHPHILPLYDSGEADGSLFYVMPNMEGNSLREWIDSERQLPLPDALRIALEVAAALDYAHRSGVVHRDIKPENILLHEGAAMVADFGIGKAASATDGSITKTGIALGTPAYMSPEQASGEGIVDGRSDLYSLGCVLYEMLTGEQPFTGPTVQAVIAKRFIAPIPRVSVTRDVPDGVDQTVGRALARTPVDRFATAAEFVDALNLIRGDAPFTPPGGRPAAAPPRKSIAVLPFANRSADPENEYFSDGMTEEIINVLAKVPGMQVASRTSSFAFKDKEVDVREVGDKLGVGTVLEGSVRKAGNRIRISAELIDVTNGYHLWSESYDRQMEDVFAIQDEISRAIVDALKVQLGGDTERLVVPATENLEAYTMYLKGRFFVNVISESEIRRGLDFFEGALAEDPNYAQAYSGIADCWCNIADNWVEPGEAYPRAKAAAEQALALEPNLAEALTSIGKVRGWYEWDFRGAEEVLRRAVQINPNYAEAHFVFGSALPSVGKLDEAIGEMRQALVVDPLSAHFSRWLGRFLGYARDFDGSIAQTRKTIEMTPEYFLSYLDLGTAHLAQGDAEEALKWFRHGQSLKSAVRSYDALIVRALAALGERDEAEPIMQRLEEESKRQYVRQEVLAMGYAALGDLDRAFGCLNRALAQHSAGLVYLHIDPGFDPLRSDPRYTALVERIGVT
ncbi:MAG: protein kinase [Gemmatimonadales bacterium]|jgi:serine/threonine protein kinase/tetratricopeptide (TPR) repeat protein